MTHTYAFSSDALHEALERYENAEAEVLRVLPIAADRAQGELKSVGYGEPLLVEYRTGGVDKRLVFRTMGANWYGHDRRSDRAQLALVSADTYNAFPRHIKCVEVGALEKNGRLSPLPEAAEFYLLTTFEEGRLYAVDLREMEQRPGCHATDVDLARVDALAKYLAALHQDRVHGPPPLYERAVRDLIGSGEGIFGIADGYPDDGPVAVDRIRAIEAKCIEWRYKLRRRAHRLRRTHGDFHPYNILFRESDDFALLDASRGGVGDPADDLAALAINYFFGGAVSPAAWPHGHGVLWRRLWRTYFKEREDPEVLEVLAPFLTWRALVVASPVWYPRIPNSAREALLTLAEESLRRDRFDPDDVGRLIPS